MTTFQDTTTPMLSSTDLCHMIRLATRLLRERVDNPVRQFTRFRLVHNWCTNGAHTKTTWHGHTKTRCIQALVGSAGYEVGSASGVDVRTAHGIVENVGVGDSPPLRFHLAFQAD